MMKCLDPSRNGYVTNQELEDTLKQMLPQKLLGYNLKPLLKRFASIQNKLLIDYKRFIKTLRMTYNQCAGNYQQSSSDHLEPINSAKEIFTKEDQRRQQLRPSVNMAAAMEYTKDNYFKYDPGKYGHNKQTRIEETKKQRATKKDIQKLELKEKI